MCGLAIGAFARFPFFKRGPLVVPWQGLLERADIFSPPFRLQGDPSLERPPPLYLAHESTNSRCKKGLNKRTEYMK